MLIQVLLDYHVLYSWRLVHYIVDGGGGGGGGEGTST